MNRPATPDDTDTLCALATTTNVFYDHEIDTLRVVLDDYHDAADATHRAVTIVDGDAIAGFAYYALDPMTDGTWELWWIVVDPARHGRGLGQGLMAHVEADVAANAGRLMLIETSSLPKYEPTRRFYLRRGYAECARIADFYKRGDDKVIYRRSFDDSGSEHDIAP